MLHGQPDLVVVIMAGGAGTRFWPLSTAEKPKQFLGLFGERTLIQQSYDRVSGLVKAERVLVLTGKSMIPLVREQLPGLPENNIIGEPVRRDTAAAVALAALVCRKRYGNPVMAVLPADHLIEPMEAFQAHLLSAARVAASEPALLTFGIEPSYPATCYGYIERGELLADDSGIKHYELLRFQEKPDLETARKYVDSGKFYWNSGIFVWSVETILAEFGRQLPGHLKRIGPAVDLEGGQGWDSALREAFESIPATSIDFGVMEHAERARTLAAKFYWNDVGGWLALEEFMDRDKDNNAHRGNLETLDSSGNLVFCKDPDQTVALVGVKDLVVVRAGERTLVVARNRAEDLKKLVTRLERKNRP